MDEPVTGWAHDVAVEAASHDCLAWAPNADELLLYDPASSTGDAWLASQAPLDLRAWA
jgi:hypothetical protein